MPVQVEIPGGDAEKGKKRPCHIRDFDPATISYAAYGLQNTAWLYRWGWLVL